MLPAPTDQTAAVPRFSVAGAFLEQQVYADTDAAGRINRLALRCSGFQPEAPR